MPRRAWSRAPVVFLLTSLLACPVLAAQKEIQDGRSPGLLLFLWEMVVDLLPETTELGPGLDPLGRDQSTPQGDLGPGLDPLG